MESNRFVLAWAPSRSLKLLSHLRNRIVFFTHTRRIDFFPRHRNSVGFFQIAGCTRFLDCDIQLGDVVSFRFRQCGLIDSLSLNCRFAIKRLLRDRIVYANKAQANNDEKHFAAHVTPFHIQESRIKKPSRMKKCVDATPNDRPGSRNMDHSSTAHRLLDTRMVSLRFALRNHLMRTNEQFDLGAKMVGS
mgnify:FL=1|jgi:hypothetical protein